MPQSSPTGPGAPNPGRHNSARKSRPNISVPEATTSSAHRAGQPTHQTAQTGEHMTENSNALADGEFPRHERRGVIMGLQWYQLALARGVSSSPLCPRPSAGPAGTHGLPARPGCSWCSLASCSMQRTPYPTVGVDRDGILLAATERANHLLPATETPSRSARSSFPEASSPLTIHRTATGECFVVDTQAREALRGPALHRQAPSPCSTTMTRPTPSRPGPGSRPPWPNGPPSPGSPSRTTRSSTRATALQDYYDQQVAPAAARPRRLGLGGQRLQGPHRRGRDGIEP